MDVLIYYIFKRGINELLMFCVVFFFFIYGLFFECCDGNVVFCEGLRYRFFFFIDYEME